MEVLFWVVLVHVHYQEVTLIIILVGRIRAKRALNFGAWGQVHVSKRLDSDGSRLCGLLFPQSQCFLLNSFALR